MKKWFLLCSALLSVSLFADSVNFISKPMSAGKASRAENAYSISRLLDMANFSPELKLPVQLVYNSSVEKSGLFGFAWRSPQLESTAYYDKDGVLWVTPWGERIKFFSKKEKTPKDAIKIELYEQAKKVADFMPLILNGKPIPPSEAMRRVTVGYFTANGIKRGGLLFTGITS